MTPEIQVSLEEALKQGEVVLMDQGQMLAASRAHRELEYHRKRQIVSSIAINYNHKY